MPAGATHFSLLQSVQTGSRAYPACCTVDTGDKKRQGTKPTDHTPALSARLRMNVLYLYSSTGIRGVHRDIYLGIKFPVRLAIRAVR